MLVFDLLNFADFSWTFAYFQNYLLPAPFQWRGSRYCNGAGSKLDIKIQNKQYSPFRTYREGREGAGHWSLERGSGGVGVYVGGGACVGGVGSGQLRGEYAGGKGRGVGGEVSGDCAG